MSNYTLVPFIFSYLFHTHTVAADNVVVALYFAFLFSISKAGEENDDDGVVVVEEKENENVDHADSELTADESVSEKLALKKQHDNNRSSSAINLPKLAISIAVASTLVTLGMILTGLLLPAGTSSLPLISVLTVLAATVFPNFFSSLSQTGTALGVAFIQMFFAASGAAGSIRLVLQQAPSLFGFSALQIFFHFLTLKSLGRWIFRLPNRELYLASNANVGGPTTAAAMAQAKEWKRLVLPALLIGILGYATATAVALSLGPILLRLPTL